MMQLHLKPRDEGVLKLACVGRLEPDAKGQDILFEVLRSENGKADQLRSLFLEMVYAEVFETLKRFMELRAGKV